MGLQELRGAVLLPELGKGALGGAGVGELGVAVALEQPVADVQHPLLGLPPGPRLPVLWVRGLTLLCDKGL